MHGTFRIAVAGLGTVGAGTVSLVRKNAELIAARCGRLLEVSAVSARDRNRNRPCDISEARWFDDPRRMAAESDADVVVELIGGADGIAKETVETALASGKHVVTANKALMAHHGNELAERAEAAGASLRFEAAVAGGIPIVKSLMEGLAANRFERVYGILNGTCNYILTQMRGEGGPIPTSLSPGREFDEVLAEAQRLGYAEADPAFDIDGIDTAHKLALLAALAFGCRVNFEAVHIEGIREISSLDIAFAEELGYCIKLLGVARQINGALEQRVHPCMVDRHAPIASVEGVFNAVVAECDFVDTVMYEGRGAGAGPTASAVVGDLIDLARGLRMPAFGISTERLLGLPTLDMERHVCPYYVRLMVLDVPGVMAEITAALRDELISLEALIQHGRALREGEAVPVVLTTHETSEGAIMRAVARIEALDGVIEKPRLIRIETLGTSGAS